MYNGFEYCCCWDGDSSFGVTRTFLAPVGAVAVAVVAGAVAEEGAGEDEGNGGASVPHRWAISRLMHRAQGRSPEHCMCDLRQNRHAESTLLRRFLRGGAAGAEEEVRVDVLLPVGGGFEVGVGVAVEGAAAGGGAHAAVAEEVPG